VDKMNMAKVVVGARHGKDPAGFDSWSDYLKLVVRRKERLRMDRLQVEFDLAQTALESCGGTYEDGRKS